MASFNFSWKTWLLGTFENSKTFPPVITDSSFPNCPWFRKCTFNSFRSLSDSQCYPVQYLGASEFRGTANKHFWFCVSTFPSESEMPSSKTIFSSKCSFQYISIPRVIICICHGMSITSGMINPLCFLQCIFQRLFISIQIIFFL